MNLSVRTAVSPSTPPPRTSFHGDVCGVRLLHQDYRKRGRHTPSASAFLAAPCPPRVLGHLRAGMGRSVPEGLGRYQASASVMLALLKMPAAWFQLSLLFMAPDVKFRCAQPLSKNNVFANESLEDIWDDSCSYREDHAGTNGSVKKCQIWEYDRSLVEESVNTVWNLVCDNELLVTWAQFSFMLGVFSGNVIGGFMANRVGRKLVLVTAVLCQPILSAVVAISPTFTFFLIVRFLLGLALGGTIVMSFVLGAEQATGPWRPAISILHQVPFGMGQTLLPLTAFFLRDWRQLQMALSVYCLIFLPYCWLIEESPQWLVAQGRLKQAERVKEAIRRRNQPTDAAVTEMRPMTAKHKPEIVKTSNMKLNNSPGRKEGMGLCGLFRIARLRRYTVSVWLMWYCAGLAFFSLNAYQTSLGGDPFINVGIGGLIGGIPGNFLTVFLVRRFGRKKVVIIAHLLASIAAILIPVYDVGDSPWDWQRRVAALFALIFMSVAFPAMFVTSGELLPAVVRAPIMEVANLMARLGNTIAPLVIPTSRFHKWAPMVVVSAAPLITALVSATLPETANRPLPVHIQDIEPAAGKVDTEGIKSEENGKIYNPVANTDS